jgi:hypothetical protein
MTKSNRPTKTVVPTDQIESFIAEFEPAVGKLIRSCRKELRKLLPRSVEQVYDNYNFLAIGFCTTERTSDCIVSLACSAKGVSLSFYWGATLPDPERILLGAGKQNRFIRLDTVALLKNPTVLTLIADAVAQAKTPFPPDQKGYAIVKSISPKKRPRR